MNYSINKNSKIFKLEGGEIRDFLNRIITTNIKKIDEQEIMFSGLLSPQGNILFDFILYLKDAVIFLEVSNQCSDGLIKKLNLYKLMADVKITDMSAEYNIIHIWGNDEIVPEDFIDGFLYDSRTKKLGLRRIVSLDEHSDILTKLASLENIVEVEHNGYLAYQYSLGVFEVGINYPQNKYYPFDFYWDRLNTISFTKGCYVGQEVISRLHHKSKVRKRALYFEIINNDESDMNIDELLKAQIIQGEKKVGEVINIKKGDKIFGIAMINTLKTDIITGKDYYINTLKQYNLKFNIPFFDGYEDRK